jgi:hypothetical protein
VIGGHNDDALLVSISPFEIVNKFPDTSINMAHLIRNAPIEAVPRPPIQRVGQGELVFGKLVHVHRLRKKQNGARRMGALLKKMFCLFYRRTHLVFIPELIGVEFHQLIGG